MLKVKDGFSIAPIRFRILLIGHCKRLEYIGNREGSQSGWIGSQSYVKGSQTLGDGSQSYAKGSQS